MPVARRTRTIDAPAADVWATVGDPYHLPRWWPNVERVEAVGRGRFTEVLVNDGGRPVRADFRVVAHEPPRRREWSQQIANTPFERVFVAATTTVKVEPDGGATRVTLSVEHRLRGVSRLGAPLVRRGTRQLLDRALDSLERLHGA